MFDAKLIIPTAPETQSLARLPSIAELVALAIRYTDFVGDLTADHPDILYLAANAADDVADLWEGVTGTPMSVPSEVILNCRAALIAHGEELLRAAEADAAAERSDAIEEGSWDFDAERLGAASCVRTYL